MSKWLRVRFRVFDDDPRPILFPPAGPYWITGHSWQGVDEFAILVAYVPDRAALLRFWPDADTDWDGASEQPHDEITFTDRFSRPSWWASDACPHHTEKE